MHALDLILCLSANLFRLYLIYRFIRIFLPEAEADRKKEAVLYVLFYVINTVLFLWLHLAWVNLICNVLGIGILVCLYTRSWKSIVFITGIIYMINIVCDVCVHFVFIHFQDGIGYSQILAAATVVCIFVCELLTEKIVSGRENKSNFYSLALIVIPLCSIVLIFLLIYTKSCSQKGIAIVGISLLLINFLMLYFYSMLLKTMEEKFEYSILQNQVQAYKNQIKLMMEGEEKIKALKHDMKHHLNELKIMSMNHEDTQIQNYVDHMQEFIQNPDAIISSGNTEIDSVINYQLKKAQEKLLTVHTKIQLPEQMKHSFDLNIILGNLLENAVEAASQTDEKYLDVRVLIKKGILSIEIENSFLPDNIRYHIQTKQFLTTKKDSKNHGIGFMNIKRILDKYDGVMNISQKENRFLVRIRIYHIFDN